MTQHEDTALQVAGKTYQSRLIIGSGKYKDFDENLAALEASGAEIITVAIRRVNLGQNADEPSLLHRRRCSAHLSNGERTSRRAQAGKTRSAR